MPGTTGILRGTLYCREVGGEMGFTLEGMAVANRVIDGELDRIRTLLEHGRTVPFQGMIRAGLTPERAIAHLEAARDAITAGRMAWEGHRGAARELSWVLFEEGLRGCRASEEINRALRRWAEARAGYYWESTIDNTAPVGSA